MAIFYVGYTKADDTFVPQTPVDIDDMDRKPQLQDVYVGAGAVTEVVGIMENGDLLFSVLDGATKMEALEHLWNSVEEE